MIFECLSSLHYGVKVCRCCFVSSRFCTCFRSNLVQSALIGSAFCT
ncbi:hypothetical protein HMPREF1576_00735 [Gardnerella pickettii JCP7719]|uniref:Uncharacterized protein n=1 Tax=Gardnerella pickettii JCP7719 TaxID=1261061 RepID=S4GVC5_9BIFI|nr:hypothetical protein HMPREF1576_00735 [Gardnerella pickettii JCP7719]